VFSAEGCEEFPAAGYAFELVVAAAFQTPFSIGRPSSPGIESEGIHETVVADRVIFLADLISHLADQLSARMRRY